MGMKLAAASAAMMLVLCGVFYWYYTDTQERMAIMQENNAKLEIAAETSEAAIQSLQKDILAASQELENVNKEFSAIRRQNEVLANKLERHDLGVLGAAKPGLVERVITRASNKATRCFELLSGSELTESEKNAKNANEFNSECPWLWPGDSTP
jgi:septal ring factor EnvC (AmiA/AmiB activator)